MENLIPNYGTLQANIRYERHHWERYILLNLHQKKLEETISWCLTVTWKVSFHKILSSISLVSNIGKMSSGEVRKVSREDIQVVQNLIERCLQLYMNQKEVVNTLLVRAKIEPGFTELVWKKLEEENQEFFKAYYLRLIVKEQIMEFNRLLERQVQLMRQICPAEVASLPMSNGSHIQQVQQDSACYAPDLSGLTLKAQSMSQPIGSSLPHTYLQNAIDMSGHATSIDVLPNTVSNVGMMRGTNGGMVKPEAGYLESSQYMFGNDGNVLLGCPANGDASVSSFGSVGSHSQPFYESLLGANGAFGHLGPRNFSFSDLTVDMANYADILGNYSRSPFVAPDTNFFLDPHGRGQHQGANPPPC